MAVIQISKIQVRRGKKNVTGEVPQLSSGEFAWAIDAQELYIGNGSITEGAPYVGNTKILTENDNILELSSGYTFGAGAEGAITSTVPRSLQGKIDEIEVSAVDFGADPTGTGVSDDAFESAFANLIDPAKAVAFAKVLKVPTGNYRFERDLEIPSGIHILGENPTRTILQIGSNDIRYVGVDNDRPSDIVIENITINHTTGKTDITGSENCTFTNVRWTSGYGLNSRSVFNPTNANCIYIIPSVTVGGNISFSGTGVSNTITTVFTTDMSVTLNIMIASLNADPVFSLNYVADLYASGIRVVSFSSLEVAENVAAAFTVQSQSSNITSTLPVAAELVEFNDGDIFPSVFWNNDVLTRVNDVTFDKCRFAFTPVGVQCVQTTVFNTKVYFKDCTFFNCDTGIYIEGVPEQESDWRINDCKFEEIAFEAFKSTSGRNTVLQQCRFINCGNGTNNAAFPVSNIVSFGESRGNIVMDCSSNRHQAMLAIVSEDTYAVCEVNNSSKTVLIDMNYSDIRTTDAPATLCVLSSTNTHTYIDYSLQLSIQDAIVGNGTEVTTVAFSRVGRITIAMDSFRRNDSTQSPVSFTDSYNYSESSIENLGAVVMTNFEFDVKLTDSLSPLGNETMVVSYKNPKPDNYLPIDEFNMTGSISYSISYGV